MSAFVYILASERNGTLYIGVTIDLPKGLFDRPYIRAEVTMTDDEVRPVVIDGPMLRKASPRNRSVVSRSSDCAAIAVENATPMASEKRSECTSMILCTACARRV